MVHNTSCIFLGGLAPSSALFAVKVNPNDLAGRDGNRIELTDAHVTGGPLGDDRFYPVRSSRGHGKVVVCKKKVLRNSDDIYRDEHFRYF